MTMTESSTDLKDGRIVGIAGPVVDVEFPRGALPELNSAVEFDITLDPVSKALDVRELLDGGDVSIQRVGLGVERGELLVQFLEARAKLAVKTSIMLRPMRASARQPGVFSSRDAVGWLGRSWPVSGRRPQAILSAGSARKSSRSSQSS